MAAGGIEQTPVEEAIPTGRKREESKVENVMYLVIYKEHYASRIWLLEDCNTQVKHYSIYN